MVGDLAALAPFMLDDAAHAAVQKTRELTTAYLDIVRAADEEDAISVGMLLRGYRELSRVMFGFYLVPLWAARNAVVWAVNKFGSRFGCAAWPFTRNHVIGELIYCWDRVRHGELPFPPLILFGPVTRLLLTRHLTYRLESLVSLLRQEELRWRLSAGDAQPASANPYRPAVAHVVVLQSILTKKAGFKGAALLTSIVGPITSAASAFGLSSFLKTHAPELLAGPGDIDGVAALIRLPLVLAVLALLVQFVAISAIAFISCFMRKRELLLAEDAFSRERLLFGALTRSHPREFPLDLLVPVPVVLLTFAGVLAQQLPMMSTSLPAHTITELQVQLVVGVLLTSLLCAWTWNRRNSLGRR